MVPAAGKVALCAKEGHGVAGHVVTALDRFDISAVKCSSGAHEAIFAKAAAAGEEQNESDETEKCVQNEPDNRVVVSPLP